MPRKSKLNEEFIKQAVKLIEAGNYQKHVAQALGITETTWYRWMQEGEKAKSGLKRKFYESIKKAEARAVLRNVAKILQASQEGNWQAAAWWLERRYPDEWGRKDKLDMNTQGEIKILVEKVYTTKEEGEK